jgi:hypothetical protein
VLVQRQQCILPTGPDGWPRRNHHIANELLKNLPRHKV